MRIKAQLRDVPSRSNENITIGLPKRRCRHTQDFSGSREEADISVINRLTKPGIRSWLPASAKRMSHCNNCCAVELMAVIFSVPSRSATPQPMLSSKSSSGSAAENSPLAVQ